MASTTHWDGSAMPPQEDKLAIVTGANCGIGFEVAKALATHGAHVVLACRDDARGRRAEAAIRQALAAGASGSVEFMQVDIGEPESVRAFAQAFRARHDRLDLLVNNAGVAVPPPWQRANSHGLESHFATNHLGHFYLTSLHWDLLRSSRSQARVVNVTSGLHVGARLDVASWGRTRGDSIRDYAESKMANVLFTNELQRRLQTAGVRNVAAVAAHPGVSHTQIWKKYIRTKLPRSRHLQAVAMAANALLPFMPQEVGALPTLYAATDPSVRGGEYIGPDGWLTLRGYPAVGSSHPAAQSLENGRKVWELSERLLQIKFHV